MAVVSPAGQPASSRLPSVTAKASHHSSLKGTCLCNCKKGLLRLPAGSLQQNFSFPELSFPSYQRLFLPGDPDTICRRSGGAFGSSYSTSSHLCQPDQCHGI